VCRKGGPFFPRDICFARTPRNPNWAKTGNEFGAPTGRPAPFRLVSLVALKYPVDINGAPELMMMKSDVLSGFKEVKAATSYLYMEKE